MNAPPATKPLWRSVGGCDHRNRLLLPGGHGPNRASADRKATAVTQHDARNVGKLPVFPEAAR